MITQSVESVVEFLKYRGLSQKPLPEKIDLPGMILVLSNKSDAYYSVNAKTCSCPAAAYHRGPCKHMRKFFSQATKPEVSASEESIRPSGKWPGGFNGPVDLESIKAKTEPNKTGA